MLGSSFIHVNGLLGVTFTTHKPACVAGVKNKGRKKERARVSQAGYAQTYFEIEEKIAAAAPAVLPFSKMAVAHGEATFLPCHRFSKCEICLVTSKRTKEFLMTVPEVSTFYL